MDREGTFEVRRLGREVCGWFGGGGCLRFHAACFVLAATALALLNVARSPEDLWFWQPLAWWVMLLAAHAALAVGGGARALGRLPSNELPQRAAAPASAARGRREPLAHEPGFDSEAGAGRRPAPDTDDIAATSLPGGDESAFASWARATDAWAANGHAVGGPGRLRDWLSAPLRGGLARAGTLVVRGKAVPESIASAQGSPSSSSTTHRDRTPPPVPVAAPTGRFRTSLTDADRDGARAPDPATPADAVPDDVAALWLPPHPPRDREADRRPPAGGPSCGTGLLTPAATTADGTAAPVDPPAATPTNHRPPALPNQDVVLSGPMPVDASDPQWAWLEAAASAWLARREADGDHPPAPIAGVNGANGNLSAHR